MPAEAERQIKKQGGTARYRTLKKGDKLFTCAITRKEGPKGGRTVCWPKESVEEGRGRRVNPLYMQKALNNLRRRNPTGYAQWLVNAPFGIVPSYAWEDPNSDWWASPEAFSTLEAVRRGALGESMVIGPSPLVSKLTGQ